MRKHIIWNIDLDLIQNSLDNSSSYVELFEKLDLVLSKSLIKMLQYRIKVDGIDRERFIKNTKKTKFNEELDLSHILIENSKYFSSSNLKQKLIKREVLEYKCSICGIIDWNGKELSLQLDHINGINNDNRLENLRLLCPNCHSQTDTYAGKKKKIKKEKLKFCQICGIEVDKKIFCSDCNMKISSKRRKVDRPSQEELKKMVSEIGYSATGRKFGVSDNAIRKWIKN